MCDFRREVYLITDKSFRDRLTRARKIINCCQQYFKVLSLCKVELNWLEFFVHSWLWPIGGKRSFYELSKWFHLNFGLICFMVKYWFGRLFCIFFSVWTATGIDCPQRLVLSWSARNGSTIHSSQKLGNH